MKSSSRLITQVVYLQSGRKAVDISCSVCTPPGPGNGGEADEGGRLLSGFTQEAGGGNVAEIAVASKSTVSTSPSGVDGSFRNLYVRGIKR